MNIREIQIALAKTGLLPGPIDGVWGRQTASAVRKFQFSHGLEVDGVVGPQTGAALMASTGGTPAAIAKAGADVPLVWFQEAARQYGTKETPGPASNPKIIDWAGALGITYRSDDIPWCGLFVAHCIGSTLDREPLPGNPLGARAWERFGFKVEPTKGAVLVFWRKTLASGLGHVGFYVGEDETAYCVLGGNQSDRVSIAWVAKDRLLSARWPVTFTPPLTGATHIASRTGDLSINEA
jgi:uncharacterized protein (TIGR02594 family)